MPDLIHPHDDARGDVHPLPVSRRKFLTRSAAAVAGGVLFSCTGGKVIPHVTDDPTPAIDTATPIKRVIYVMLENRSFNNVFGAFPGVEGTSTGVSYGQEMPLTPCPDWLPGDLPHDRSAYLNCYNDGKLDGFGTGHVRAGLGLHPDAPAPRSPTTGSGPTSTRSRTISSHRWPGRPTRTTSSSSRARRAASSTTRRTSRSAGPARRRTRAGAATRIGDDVFVFTKDDQGNLTKHDTCFSFPTVGQQLSHRGIDWAFYSAVPGESGYFWNAYNGVSEVFHSDLWHQHTRSVDNIVNDIKASKLPAGHVGDAPVRAVGSPPGQHRRSPTTGSRTSWTP